MSAKTPEETNVHKAKPGRPLRRAPVRTCVACQQAKAKRELIRVVHTPAGAVEIDLTGKKAGRGAYLCTTKSCWQLALKKHALERALKTTISSENLAVLDAYVDTLKE
jgi:hypothetical protein